MEQFDSSEEASSRVLEQQQRNDEQQCPSCVAELTEASLWTTASFFCKLRKKYKICCVCFTGKGSSCKHNHFESKLAKLQTSQTRNNFNCKISNSSKTQLDFYVLLINALTYLLTYLLI